VVRVVVLDAVPSGGGEGKWRTVWKKN
jgi:hypothetical protein